MTKEREIALQIADKVLERPHADPDDDLAIVSRQLLRMNEELQLLKINGREREK